METTNNCSLKQHAYMSKDMK